MSLFGILPLSFQLLRQRWDLGITSCKAYAIFVQIIGPIEASALATIAVTRCTGIINRNNWETFSHKKRNIILLLITPWFLSFPTLLPYLVKSANVEVGWSCTFGLCGTISSCQRSTSPDSCYEESTWIDDFIPIYMLVLILSSIIIITTCYILINQTAKRSSEQYRKAYLYAWRYITFQKNMNETNAINDKELNRIYSTVSSAYRFLRQLSTGSKLNNANDP